MSITFRFQHVHGSYDDIHDRSKIVTVTYETTLIVPQVPNPTLRMLFKPQSKCFTNFWRVIWAGEPLDWDDALPPSANEQTLTMVGSIAHWASDNYVRNFPILALPNIIWIRK